MDVLGRYKNLVILVGVLFLQVLGLAVQVKRSGEAENTRLIRIWAVSAITPFERSVVWVQNGVSGVWHNYFYLRGVRNENRQLKDQIEQMRLEQVRLREDAAQAQRLQSLLAFKEQFVSKTVAAQVIGSSASDLSRIVYIDKGDDEGLKRDMAVITADGIVGKVLQVFPNVSQVLLINDQSSGVGAILEKSRLQGVLRGTTSGEVGLERVMSDEQVSVGDKILTSGGDGIFPKGLPIGSVTKVAPGKDLFLNIKVKPSTDLSRLEEVLVLAEKQERPAPSEIAGGRVRAADILAQRLPSVPDKPADANPANPTSGTKPASGATASQSSPTANKSPNSAGVPHTTSAVGQSGSQPGSQPGTANAPKASAPKNTAPKSASIQPVGGTTSVNSSRPSSATKPTTSPSSTSSPEKPANDQPSAPPATQSPVTPPQPDDTH